MENKSYNKFCERIVILILNKRNPDSDSEFITYVQEVMLTALKLP